MGAHTLGQAKEDQSGHNGFWIPGCRGRTTFDNEYYQRLTAFDIPWMKKVILLNGHI
jgi:hypothetical protein